MAQRVLAKVFFNYERFWHWSQAALILTLIATGARLHGLIDGFPWEAAFRIHLFAAAALFVLWLFTVFWHFATGEWTQYLPTSKNLIRVARYYAYGIFVNEAHPSKPTTALKHNPLQRITYLLLTAGIAPAIWATGAAYMLVNYLPWGLEPVALAHTIAAYAMVVFVIIHIYMATTGETVFSYLRAMITGYQWVYVDSEAPATRAEAEMYRGAEFTRKVREE
jgi:thiosulfate reductase cytochrome b subunit